MTNPIRLLKTAGLILLCFMVLVVTVFFLTSCQKTPEDKIVVGKNAGEFEDALQGDLPDDYSQEQYINSLPDNYSASYEKYNGKLKIEIDAEMVFEEGVTKYPIVTIKPYYISKEQANGIVKEIFSDTPVYHNHFKQTRQWYEDFIIEVKAEQQEERNKGNDERADSLDEVIANIYEEMKDAPEEITLRPFDGEFDVYSKGDNITESLSLRVDPTDRESPILTIYNIISSKYTNGYDTEVLYEDVSRSFYSIGQVDTDDEETIKAIERAEEFLANIKVDNAVVDKIYSYSTNASKSQIDGYRIFFAKEFNDIVIPTFIQMGGSRAQSDEDYVAPFRSESMQIYVEGDEIVYFEWNNIYDIDTTLNENMPLLLFDEIMANVQSQLSAKYAPKEDEECATQIYIDKIILTYAVEPIKDRKYEYMLVPAWAFYGGYDYGDGYKDAMGNIYEGKQDILGSMLTINAVEGSIIE